jgi:hypothetical protein
VLGLGLLALGPLGGSAAALPVSCIPGGSTLTTCTFAEDLGKGDASGERLGPGEHPNADLAQQQFLQMLVGSVRTENFETFGDDTLSPIALPFPGAGSEVFAAILDSAPTGFGRVNEVTDPTGTNGVGRFPVDGTKYYETGQSIFHIIFCSDPTTLTACEQSLRPVAAFGFYATDIGEADPAIEGRLSVELLHTDGSSVVIPVPHESTIGGSASYLGIIDPVGFDEVIFRTRLNDIPTGGLDAFGFDLFTVALAEQVQVPVPMPPGLLLLLPGIVALPAIRRRPRRR